MRAGWPPARGSARMRNVFRALTLLAFLGIVALGGSGGGFVAELLLAGPVGILPAFFWLSASGLALLVLGWIPPLRRWSGQTDLLGAALLLLAALELGRAIEGFRLVLLTGSPFLLFALLLAWRSLREAPPAPAPRDTRGALSRDA
jgi:hypothetical protein